MFDVRLFRNLRLSAACGAVTLAWFCLFGFIFLITQYFQFLRGYGPLTFGEESVDDLLRGGAGPLPLREP
jgi:hypothetical protein